MPSIRATRAKLATYRSKRDFANTREPSGKKAVKPTGHSYLTPDDSLASGWLRLDLPVEIGSRAR